MSIPIPQTAGLTQIVTTSGAQTFQLPDASLIPAAILQFKKVSSDSHVATIDPFAGQTIDGGSSAILSSQWDCLTLRSIGASGWVKISAIYAGGGGLPAGSDTWLQYNKGGIFGADSNAVWDYTNQNLIITGHLTGFVTTIGTPTGIGVSTGISIINTAGFGDGVYIGASNIGCLYQNVSGQLLWYFSTVAGGGTFALSNGSGSGGFDSLGAQIYGNGYTGYLQCISFEALGNALIFNSPFTTVIGSESSGTYAVTINTFTPIYELTLSNLAIRGSVVSGDKQSWFLGNPGGVSYGNFILSNGTGSGGFDSNGGKVTASGQTGFVQCVQATMEDGYGYTLQLGNVAGGVDGLCMLLTVTAGGNAVYLGTSSIGCLYSNTSNHFLWYLSYDGNNCGTLAISNNTGTGGFDSLGAQLYGDGYTGAWNCVSLLVSGGSAQVISGNLTVTNGSYATTIGSVSSGANAIEINTSSTNVYKITATNLALRGLVVSTGHETFFLGNPGGASYGNFALCNGTGTGGFDGNGGLIVGTGQTGLLEATTLNLTNALGAAYGGTGQTTYTKGDLLVSPGSTLSRLPIGTNGYVLTADSSQTNGLAWEAAVSLPLTTKGDLLVYNSGLARLPIGSNGQVLTADSTQTNGLAWETGGVFPLTAWTGYFPSVTADVGSTSGLSINTARYQQVGKTVFVRIYISFSYSSSSATKFFITLPVVPLDLGNVLAAWITPNYFGLTYPIISQQFAANSSFVLCAIVGTATGLGIGGSSLTVQLEGVYEAA